MRISSNLFCLEDNTEQSESNPGRSLGMDKAGMDNCLEDSTLILLSGCLVDSQTKQQNTQSTKQQNNIINMLPRLTAQCARAQNQSRIKPMRRILSFSRISFNSWIYMVLDLFRIVFAPIRRGLPTAYRSHRETYRIEIRRKSTA